MKSTQPYIYEKIKGQVAYKTTKQKIHTYETEKL